MNLRLLSSEIEQTDLIIKSICNAVDHLLKLQPQIILAVSGGKSPISLFQKLSSTNLPWNKIIITLVDERVTDTNSEDSNENLVRRYLLQSMAAKADFRGLILPKQTIKQILDEANIWVKQIDIAILGMGEDGHTASIFPECPEFRLAIDKNREPAYIETNPISAKYKRIGLNLSGLINIKHLILSARGSTKLNVIKEAAQADNPNYPVSYLLGARPDINIFIS